MEKNFIDMFDSLMKMFPSFCQRLYMPISIRLHQHQINKRSIFIITLFQLVIYQEGRLRLYCRGRGIKIHVNLIAVLTRGIEKHKIDLMI